MADFWSTLGDFITGKLKQPNGKAINPWDPIGDIQAIINYKQQAPDASMNEQTQQTQAQTNNSRDQANQAWQHQTPTPNLIQQTQKTQVNNTPNQVNQAGQQQAVQSAAPVAQPQTVPVAQSNSDANMKQFMQRLLPQIRPATTIQNQNPLANPLNLIVKPAQTPGVTPVPSVNQQDLHQRIADENTSKVYVAGQGFQDTPMNTFDQNKFIKSQSDYDALQALRTQIYGQLQSIHPDISEEDRQKIFEKALRDKGFGNLLDQQNYADQISQQVATTRDNYLRALNSAPKAVQDYYRKKNDQSTQAYLAYQKTNPDDVRNWSSYLDGEQTNYANAIDVLNQMEDAKKQYDYGKQVASTTVQQAQQMTNNAKNALDFAKAQFVKNNADNWWAQNSTINGLMMTLQNTPLATDAGVQQAQKKLNAANQLLYDVKKYNSAKDIIQNDQSAQQFDPDYQKKVSVGGQVLLDKLKSHIDQYDPKGNEQYNQSIQDLDARAGYLWNAYNQNPNDAALKAQFDNLQNQKNILMANHAQTVTQNSYYGLLTKNPQIYNAYAYYIGNNGGKIDDDTLDYLVRDLNQQSTQNYISQLQQEYKDKPAEAGLSAAFNIGNGIGVFAQNLGQSVSNAATDEYKPTDMNGFGTASEKITNAEKEIAENGLNPVQKAIADYAMGIPSKAAAMLLGPVGPIYSTIQAAGDSTYDALQRGATPDQSLTKGTIDGGISYALDKVFKTAQTIDKSSAKKLVGPALKSLGLDVLNGGVKEAAQTATQVISDVAIMKDKNQLDLYIKEFNKEHPDIYSQAGFATAIYILSSEGQAFVNGALNSIYD